MKIKLIDTMIHTTHILFAILMLLLSPSISAEAVLFVAIGSLLPDIDHPSSYINRKSWKLFSLSLITTHRGWCHSLVGGAAFTILLALVGAAFYPFLLGYLSHLILDSLNPSGVAWFWPKKRRYAVGIVKTGSMAERAVQVSLLVAILFLALK